MTTSTVIERCTATNTDTEKNECATWRGAKELGTTSLLGGVYYVHIAMHVINRQLETSFRRRRRFLLFVRHFIDCTLHS